jgi:hypothetical protein
MSAGSMIFIMVAAHVHGLLSISQKAKNMVQTKHRGRRTFVPVFPELHRAKRKRVWFSVLNVIIVVAIVILLTFTLFAIL